VAGPARPEGRYTFESLGEGDSTRLRFELSWRPTGLRRLLSGMVGRQMAVEVAKIRNAKSVLETSAKD
jgi:hypothetical protein